MPTDMREFFCECHRLMPVLILTENTQPASVGKEAER
jgi:hypothetical protein